MLNTETGDRNPDGINQHTVAGARSAAAERASATAKDAPTAENHLAASRAHLEAADAQMKVAAKGPPNTSADAYVAAGAHQTRSFEHAHEAKRIAANKQAGSDSTPQPVISVGDHATARVSVADLLTLTDREITADGYLKAPATINRTGTQVYLASELGDALKHLPANKRVTLYRPPEEVFKAATLKSFDAVPITVLHPSGNRVTADNWSDVAVGDMHDPVPNGPVTKATVVIRDADAVHAVQSGKSALSCGYDFNLDMTPGTLSDGTAYDGIQRNITGNHLAIVDVARGGYVCRIGDSQRKERHMSMKTIVIDGISLEMESVQADLVNKLVGDAKAAVVTATAAVTAADGRAVTAEKALDLATKAHTVALDAANAKVKELEGKQVTQAQIEAMSAERTSVVGDALKLMPELKAEGKTVHAIRVEALTHAIASDEKLKSVATACLGDTAPDKADEQIARLAFKVVVAQAGTTAGDASQIAADAEMRAATGRAMAGAGDGGGAGGEPKLVGRDLMIARAQSGHYAKQKTQDAAS